MTAEQIGTFDYIVVGAGSAGCLLANRLTANGRHRVLLLEAGGSDRRVWVRVPIGYLYCIGNPKTDWCYSTASEPGLNGRSLRYPRGKVLGGCSSINGMIYMRGQSSDYDFWAEQGNSGWSWDDVVPFFERFERGELRIEEQRLHWPILDAVRNAAEEIGIPRTNDFNRGTNLGVGYFKVNQSSGLRWSAARAFLYPAMKRRNLTLVKHAEVEQIILNGKSAVGVTFTHNGNLLQATCGSEVVLAAGAIGSPKLLEQSGIGSEAILSKAGIRPRHVLGGVGENLQDHLQIRTVFRVKNALTLNELQASVLGRLRIGLQYLLTRSGPMSMAPSQLGVFCNSDDSQGQPNLEYHVQPLSLSAFGEPLDEFPAITVSVCNLRPESRGSSHISSRSPQSSPVISPRYLSTENDRAVALESIKHVRLLMATSKLKPYQPTEYLPGTSVTDSVQLLESIGDIATTIFHPVGTAKMGAGRDAVVDQYLKVHGLQGLRIVDASVMPTIVSGNTHGPVLMIAEKAAEMILADIG